MRIVKWLKSLHTYQKFIILACITILIAVFNFYYYNFQILKLPKEKIKYSINLETIERENFIYMDGSLTNEKKDKSAKVSISLSNDYIRYIIVDFESLTSQFPVSLDAKLINNFGTVEDYTSEQKCYGNLTKCGFKLNKQAQQVEIKFSDNIKIKSITIDNSPFFNWITFIFLCVFLDLSVIVLMFDDFFSKKIHILSFVLSLGIGFLFLFATHGMTSTTYDGQTHFIFYNDLKSTKTEADLQFERDNHRVTGVVEFTDLDTKVEKKDYNRLMNELANNKVNNAIKRRGLLPSQRIIYFPVALVLKISPLFHLNYTTSIFLARVTQLLLYSLVIMWAVKVIPNYKLLCMFLCLCPQMLFFATNFNYDPAVIASLILGFSIFANEYFHKEKKMNKANVFIAIVAILYGALAKFVYILFLLLFLLLPKEKFLNKKQKSLFSIIIVGIVISLFLAKCFIMITAKSGTSTILALGQISPMLQISSVFSHPFSFFSLFWKEVILKGTVMMFSPETFGRLSYYGTMSIEISYLLLLFIYLITFIAERKPINMKKRDKIIMLGLYFMIISLIWGGMYLCWTPVGSNVINGVQPRYYIPLLLPILYCFSITPINQVNEKSLISLSTILYVISVCLFVFNLIISVYDL